MKKGYQCLCTILLSCFFILISPINSFAQIQPRMMEETHQTREIRCKAYVNGNYIGTHYVRAYWAEQFASKGFNCQ